jgi:hypothetical protein
VKWISVIVITFLIAWFWPSSDFREPFAKENSKPPIETLKRPSDRKARVRRPSRGRLSDEDLGKRITVLWFEISNDPRDPKVVEFIRLLREFGKRDEKKAFALLDRLDWQEKEEHWYQARMAVTGGWALRDPAEAVKALLTEGSVLPKDFVKRTSTPVQLPADLPGSGRTFPRPSQVAILRQASEIFKAWSKIDPEEATRFANALPRDETNAELRRMLFKHVSRVVGGNSGSASVNRASIDAILNNPLRTTSRSYSSFGAEIHGDPEGIYGDLTSEGEPAFTFEGWAARNPERAKESLQDPSAHPLWHVNLILGLARVDSDYLGLLELIPPDKRFGVATEIVSVSAGKPHDEPVWQLDGRESSWTLDYEQRQDAIQRLVDEGGFSPEERATLEKRMEAGAGAYDFMKLMRPSGD